MDLFSILSEGEGDAPESVPELVFTILVTLGYDALIDLFLCRWTAVVKRELNFAFIIKLSFIAFSRG